MTVDSLARAEVGTLLDRARDAGDAMEVGAIREEAGIGHDDLMEVLNDLREAGEAVEATPGEWRRPFDDEVPGDREPLHVHESSEETLAEAEERAGGRPAAAASSPSPSASVAADAGEVRLTMAVASALEAKTIGDLVMAGMTEAKEQARAFVLRIEP